MLPSFGKMASIYRVYALGNPRQYAQEKGLRAMPIFHAVSLSLPNKKPVPLMVKENGFKSFGFWRIGRNLAFRRFFSAFPRNFLEVECCGIH